MGGNKESEGERRTRRKTRDTGRAKRTITLVLEQLGGS